MTDADGRAHWDAPLKNAPRGLYETFTSATFAGDIDYVRTSIVPDVLVGKGTPVITWPAPAPITYSFPVNSTQLNATANVPGTFSYSPSSGTLLPAGERTLSVTFTPTDTANYNATTATRTLTVNKATPNVVIEGAGSWAYTGSPRAAVGKVKDRFNVVIATPALTYNGSPDPPVMPGEYTVVATFPGNANYEAGSASATLTITKSTVDIQINVNDVTYDGQPHPAGVTVSGLHPDFFAPDSVTYNGSTDNPVNAGTYTVVATFNGTAIYEAATATRTFVIRKATPTVTVNGGTFTYNGQPHPATGSVTGIGGAPIGTPTFTYNGGAAPPVTVGTYEVVATYAGSANYEPASATTAIAILQATAVLDWPLPQTIVYGTPLGQAQLNATANVPGHVHVFAGRGHGAERGRGAGADRHVHPGRPELQRRRHREHADRCLEGRPGPELVPAGSHRLRHAARFHPAQRDGERAGHVHVLARRWHRAERRRVADTHRNVHPGRLGQLQRRVGDRDDRRLEGDRHRDGDGWNVHV